MDIEHLSLRPTIETSASPLEMVTGSAEPHNPLAQSHMWCPDVYGGAPTLFNGMIASGPFGVYQKRAQHDLIAEALRRPSAPR